MVILYNPRSSAGRKPILPLSLLAIAAGLQRDWVLVDGNLDDPVARIAGLLQDHDGPAVLAVTVMPGPQLQEAVPVCRALAGRFPALRVVWGGYFPSQHARTCLTAPFVHHVLRGHAEHAFPALVEALLAGEEPGPLPGLVDANHDAEMPPLPDPATLPPVPVHRIDGQRYVRHTWLGRRTLGYCSSHGCPFTCNFCAVVNLAEGRWKAQTAEQVVAGVRDYVDRLGVDAVEFYDNNFFTSEKRVRAFSEGVRDLGIAWWGEGRVDTMLGYDDATWAAMRDAGLKMVFLGAESGSEETLARMNKGGTLTPDDTLALVDKMRRYGIVPELSFVLGSPPQPEADVDSTLRFVRRLKRANPEAEVIFYLYTPVPLEGTLLDAARDAGFSWPQSLDEWVSGDWMEVIQRRSGHLPWVDAATQQRVRDFERVLNAYYPTSTDRRLTGLRRWVLRATSAWRYRTGFVRYPLELAVLQRVMRYQRPETSGF